ncbi:cation transporter [Rivibacter subsaxonicus]|uniref:Co/Zn/Cd efflux system component n=1 Tax=Rivibacter subsaxonicus TaxID=457575 RepID=A0A4Q7VN35_9BURK|nr:cation transporter [Rivibacter subsaxonicus]RZT97624.1 Co/Zn/Cd efflux system component [Rivibacter subsaxonicus]
MSSDCCDHDHGPVARRDAAFRRALWIALALNAAMFALEIGAGLAAGSVSLLADAIDFFGDSVSYALSLAVLGFAMVWRSRVALLKGLTMTAFGLFVLGRAAWSATAGVVPEPMTMGLVGVVALAVNVGVALLLYAYRGGDANMRSVWVCSRNDALGNLAVMLAALGVFGTGTAWPDLLVAAVMGMLALFGGSQVIRQALAELRAPAASRAAG